jgi:hypothetical protein
MVTVMRTGIAVLLSLALSGCQTTMYGYQSTSGGATTTATSSQVSGSGQFSGGRVAFSSGGQPISPNASGGYVKLSGSAAGVLVVALVLADFLSYFRGEPQPKPLAPGTEIAHTCSCYKNPVNGDRSAP